ncbi:MAG: hypothetical protein M1818_006423 [Claussenomyces sp. TS43310]|nr:MAG: hypothetical protein M1818_006423 [Claussenomyces sp. TS43310]
MRMRLWPRRLCLLAALFRGAGAAIATRSPSSTTASTTVAIGVAAPSTSPRPRPAAASTSRAAPDATTRRAVVLELRGDNDASVPGGESVDSPLPHITPSPSLDFDALDADASTAAAAAAPALQEKWHLTTFYTCVTLGTYSHCGWHEPVLPGGDEVAAANARPRGPGAAALCALVVVLAAATVALPALMF